jgi:hypothetical protein
MQANSSLENNLRYLFFFVFLFFVFGVYLRFEAFEAVRITEWVTRDFDRAFHLFDGDYFPLAGPERNAGGRLLGPFLYVFLTIPLFFSYSYDSIFAFNLILNLFSIIFFFWFARKYLGNITSAFSTILLCVNLVHLDSAGFPINPTFMFPLIFVFFFLLFKVSFEENTKYLPAIFLIISLGIQMHFSLATYYLIPLLLLIVFKIKINIKDIFLTLFLLALCFLPYVIYKQQFYETTIKITEVFFKQEFDLSRVFEIVSLQNLFFRINQGTSLFQFYILPEYIAKISQLFGVLSFWGLVIFSARKIRKSGFGACRIEVVLLISFYIPAIIYEITNPPTLWHYWHYFIFVVPVILLKARFLFLILHALNKEILKNLVGLLVIIGIASDGYIKFIYIDKHNKSWSQSFKSGSFYNPKQIKLLFPALMQRLNLSNEEFFTNVHWSGEFIQPIKLIDPKSRNRPGLFNQKISNKPCYYVVPKGVAVDDMIELPEEILKGLNNFFEDNTIKFDSQGAIFLSNFNSLRSKELMAFPYRTRYDQPCYTNLFNPFMVDGKTRDYLKESAGINKENGSELVFKEVSRQERFDNDSNVVNWEKTLLFFHSKLNVPIKVIVSIEKQEHKYRLRNDIFYYSWGKNLKDLIQIKQVDLQIKTDGLSEDSRVVLVPIIEPGSWIVKTRQRLVVENFSWYRNVDLPENLNLKKGKFSLKFSGKTFFPNSDKSCCLEFEFDINDIQNN